ncbi:MAG: 50S ribosomal protein L22 [Bacilli bacterium]|jgi:large subunit ribosomal protein L22
MEAKAIAKGVRMTPLKMRLVIDLIRGKDVTEAEAILKKLNRKAAVLIAKVLKSAVANAVNNLGLNKDDLYVKEAFINEGEILKRIRFGSRTHIDKHYHRTSNINIVVASKNG